MPFLLIAYPLLELWSLLEFSVKTFSVFQIRLTDCCSETFCVTFEESFRDPVSKTIKMAQMKTFYRRFKLQHFIHENLAIYERLNGLWENLEDGVGGPLKSNRIILTELGHLPDSSSRPRRSSCSP